MKRPELGRAALAVLLAIALWLIVSAEEPTAAWVPVRVMLTLDTAVVLAESPAPVRAFVVGRRRDLFKLISSPPTLQRAVTDDALDSVRIELREQDLDLPSGAELSVRDLRPRLITVRLRRLASTTAITTETISPKVADSLVTAPIKPDSVLDSLARALSPAESTVHPRPVPHDSVRPRRPPP